MKKYLWLLLFLPVALQAQPSFGTAGASKTYVNEAIAKLPIPTAEEIAKYSPGPGTVRVFVDSANGDDANDGSTPLKAKKTVTSLTNFVQRDWSGWFVEIWIMPGTYQSPNWNLGQKANLAFIWCGDSTAQLDLGWPNPRQIPQPTTFVGKFVISNAGQMIWRIYTRSLPGLYPAYTGCFVFRCVQEYYNCKRFVVDRTDMHIIFDKTVPLEDAYQWAPLVVQGSEEGYICGMQITFDSTRSQSYVATGRGRWGGAMNFQGTYISIADRNIGFYNLDRTFYYSPGDVNSNPIFKFTGVLNLITFNDRLRKSAGGYNSLIDLALRPHQFQWNKGYLPVADSAAIISLVGDSDADVYYRNGPTAPYGKRINYNVVPGGGNMLLLNRATNTGRRFVSVGSVVFMDSSGITYPTGNKLALTDSLGTRNLTGTGYMRFTGTYNSGDTVAALGSGTRMMWYPRLAAFRAGTATGTEWNHFRIGGYSFASGYNTLANGGYSTAMGSGSWASGSYSFGLGTDVRAMGNYSTAMGSYTLASGVGSVAFGLKTTASGYFSTSMGELSEASGLRSFALGWNVKAKDSSQVSIGRYNDTTLGQIFSVGIGYPTGWRNGFTVYKDGSLGSVDMTRNTVTIGAGDSIQIYMQNVSPTDVFVISYVGKYAITAGETAPSAAVIRSNYVTLYGVATRKVNYIRMR